MEILVFKSGAKNAKNAIFRFSTWFLKTFQSTEIGPLYLKKIANLPLSEYTTTSPVAPPMAE